MNRLADSTADGLGVLVLIAALVLAARSYSRRTKADYEAHKTAKKKGRPINPSAHAVWFERTGGSGKMNVAGRSRPPKNDFEAEINIKQAWQGHAIGMFYVWLLILTVIVFGILAQIR
jgi:hypothetical protein